MSRPAERIEGRVVGRMEVICQKGGYQGKQTKYVVRWSCCGMEETLSRASILGRISRGLPSALCVRCMSRSNLAKRMPPWTPFRVGEVIAGAAILEGLAVGETMPETRYRVRWDCCLQEAELTHAQLQARRREKRDCCGHCKRVKNHEARRAVAVLQRGVGVGESALAAAGAVFCNGHWWPPLGPMGAR